MNATHAALSLLLLLLAADVEAQEAPGLPADVEAHLQARIDAGYHPGFVVGVVDADGPRVYGFGSVGADATDVPDGQTVYEIGSISKVFTALLLADMAARGEVDLDDPVAAYLPDSVAVPGGEAITLAHLALHTSGLPRLPDNFQPADPANPYADYTVAQLYDFLSGYTLPREPGAEYAYSNLGAGLLGHVLARTSGMDYEALVEERIAGPLGLGDTGIVLDASEQERLAPGYSGGRPVPNWDIPTLAGAGALRSTADDLLRFLTAGLGLAQTPLDSAMARTSVPRAVTGSKGDSTRMIGLGWHILETDSAHIVWHNGGTGGYHSFAAFDPEAKRGVVVLTNADLGADDVGFHLLDPSIPLEDVRPVADVAPEVLARYVGTYRLAPGFDITVTREGDRLYGQATNQSAFALYPASETRFFLRAVEAEVTFDIDADGAVTGLTLHQHGRDTPARKVE